jgi:hypothetical protein
VSDLPAPAAVSLTISIKNRKKIVIDNKGGRIVEKYAMYSSKSLQIMELRCGQARAKPVGGAGAAGQPRPLPPADSVAEPV